MPRALRIAPSILSADFARLGEELRAVTAAGADYIHVDVMDGHFVPNLTIGPVVVKALRPHSALPFDVHLMIAPVDPYIPDFAKAGADIITVHPEATPHIHYTLQLIREQGCAAGVVINPGTPLDAVTPVADIVDLCLVMSVNPGWGGQRYIPESTGRLAELRKRLPPEVVLEVDGGIALDTIDGARDAGTNLFVAGSSVFGADDPGAAFQELQARLG